MGERRKSPWLAPLRWLGRVLAYVVFNPLFERLGAGGLVAPESDGPIEPIAEQIKKGARVMWVGAHPDDEFFCGSLLAYTSIACKSPLHFVVLTRGDGGGAAIPIPEGQTVADVRAGELQKVAKLYNASLALNSYYNAPLPVESFPKRHELARMWIDKEDPALWIAREIRTFKPDIVLTFSPRYGATGHPEHQLTARFCLSAVRLAAEDNPALDGEPFKVRNTYFVLMKYWFLRLGGMRRDPFPPTDQFVIKTPCDATRTCAQVGADNTLPHETQYPDMSAMRTATSLLHKQYLHWVDPWKVQYDPLEPVAKGGMGADMK